MRFIRERNISQLKNYIFNFLWLNIDKLQFVLYVRSEFDHC